MNWIEKCLTWIEHWKHHSFPYAAQAVVDDVAVIADDDVVIAEDTAVADTVDIDSAESAACYSLVPDRHQSSRNVAGKTQATR